MTVIGSLAGLGVAALIARSLASFLLGVGAADGPVFAGATLPVCAAAILASYFPAARDAGRPGRRASIAMREWSWL